jgi:hypothetical protein
VYGIPACISDREWFSSTNTRSLVTEPAETVGELVGAVVGEAVGELVGEAVGELVGTVVGEDVGELVGADVGELAGEEVGEEVEPGQERCRLGGVGPSRDDRLRFARDDVSSTQVVSAPAATGQTARSMVTETVWPAAIRPEVPQIAVDGDGDGALFQVMSISAHEDDAGLTTKPLWCLADVSDSVAVVGAVVAGL